MTDLPPLERLRNARTKHDIASALDALARAPERYAVDPLIVQLAADERWLVRHSALGALGNAAGSEVEDVLLAVAERTQDPYDLVYVNAALGKVGSQRSLSYLTQAVSHAKEDVATSALAALTKIGTNRQQPLFLAALSDRRWIVKWYAMQAIEAHGDAGAVDAVLTRAQYLLRRRRVSRQGGRSELSYALGFLWRYRFDREDVASFFRDVVPSRIDRLTPKELADLEHLQETSSRHR
jgi:HEAT repeat protein